MCQMCNVKENNLFDRRLAGFEAMGRFFGYPECCIEWFLTRAKNIILATTEQEFYQAALIDKSQEGFKEGFIPCPECSKNHTPGTEHELIQNRICSAPYPIDMDDRPDIDAEFTNYITKLLKNK